MITPTPIATTFFRVPPSSTPMGRNRRLQDIIGECLAKGVEAGDVAPDLNRQEVIDLLMAAYVWVYRLAAWHDADAPAMTEVMDRQIALIARGFQPRG